MLLARLFWQKHIHRRKLLELWVFANPLAVPGFNHMLSIGNIHVRIFTSLIGGTYTRPHSSFVFSFPKKEQVYSLAHTVVLGTSGVEAWQLTGSLPGENVEILASFYIPSIDTQQ